MAKVYLLILLCFFLRITQAQRNISFKNIVPQIIFNDDKIIKANAILKADVFRFVYKNEIIKDSFLQEETFYNGNGLPICKSYLATNIQKPKDKGKFTIIDSFFYDEKLRLYEYHFYSGWNSNYLNVQTYQYDSLNNLFEMKSISQTLENGLWGKDTIRHIERKYYNDKQQVASIFFANIKADSFYKVNDFKYDEEGKLIEVITFNKDDNKGKPFFFYFYNKYKIIVKQLTFKGDIDISDEYFFNKQSQCIKHAYNLLLSDNPVEIEDVYSYNENGTVKNHQLKVNGILQFEDNYNYKYK